MKNLLCMMIVALLVFLPMMVAVAENAVLTETGTMTEDDAWDEPIDIEYEDDGTEDTEEEDMVEKEANPFVGEWLCDNASISTTWTSSRTWRTTPSRTRSTRCRWGYWKPGAATRSTCGATSRTGILSGASSGLTSRTT